MTKFGIGQAVPRTEDARLLTGRGRYTDDVSMAGQAYAYVLRSPHAHADILSIDTADALRQKDGSPLKTPPRPALAIGRVRHVGDAVAVVIAESIDAARDASELILVDYADRPAIVEPGRALDPDAAQVWDEAPGNLCFDWEKGDAAATEAGPVSPPMTRPRTNSPSMSPARASTG
jgi:carbon-monoxide dehydrogenase large subunit